MLRMATIGWVLAALCVGGVAPATADEAEYRDGQWVPTAAAGEESPEGHLARVRQLLAAGWPREAVLLARDFISEYPRHPGVEEAMHLAGVAQIDRRRWWQAYQWFEKQVDRFPTGPLYERALARQADIGEAFLAGGKRLIWGLLPLPARSEGLKILERVAERVPGTALAERCVMTVADALAADGKWVEAADAYKRYGELFRGRFRSQEAELKAADATFNQFRGTAWDETPLLEAQQLYRAYLRRFPRSEAADHAAARVVEIEHLRAKKAHQTARFYSRIGRPQAAAWYHRHVVAEYPGTPAADRSAEALAKLTAASPADGREADE